MIDFRIFLVLMIAHLSESQPAKQRWNFQPHLSSRWRQWQQRVILKMTWNKRPTRSIKVVISWAFWYPWTGGRGGRVLVDQWMVVGCLLQWTHLQTKKGPADTSSVFSNGAWSRHTGPAVKGRCSERRASCSRGKIGIKHSRGGSDMHLFCLDDKRFKCSHISLFHFFPDSCWAPGTDLDNNDSRI